MSTVPRWVPVAQHLTAEITRGTYHPGDRLPSQAEIVRTYGVGDRSARAALAHLVAIGVAVARRRDGIYVAPVLPDALTTGTAPPVPAAPQRRSLAARRHNPADAPSAGDEELTTTGHTLTHEPPPPDVALRLGTDPTEPVTTRRRILADPHGPVALRTSYTPTPLTRGTPLDEPTEPAGTWPAALHTHTGRRPTSAITRTSVHRPTTTEARHLQITRAAILLAHDETLLDTGPIDHTRTLYRDHITLTDHYRMT